jgi:chemotaxis protein MotB
MLTKKRVAVLLGLALVVALGGAGTGVYAARRAAAVWRGAAWTADENRNLREQVDRLNGQLARARKGFDDLLAQVKNREVLLARAGEAQREIERRRLAELEGRLARELLLREARGRLSEQLGAEHGAVFLTGDTLTVRLPDQLLYESGKAELSAEGQAVLRDLAELLNTSLKDCAVLVEGHTDDLPIARALQAKYPTNWELSAARASSAVVFLLEQGALAPERLSAVGRAATAPVADNDSEPGRAANRRIDIIIKLPPRRDGGNRE